jgi:hypothetical protein
VYATIDELARRERINRAYVSRILRLTLLGPEIVNAVLDRRQPADLQLDDLMAGRPLVWRRQLGIPADNDRVI